MGRDLVLRRICVRRAWLIFGIVRWWTLLEIWPSRIFICEVFFQTFFVMEYQAYKVSYVCFFLSRASLPSSSHITHSLTHSLIPHLLQQTSTVSTMTMLCRYRRAMLCTLVAIATIDHTSSFAPTSLSRQPAKTTQLQAQSPNKSPLDKITNNPTQSLLFSLSQTTAGAILGPFLDSYHSANGVLQYDSPFTAQLWSTSDIPALTTTWWVPPLFGLAGFLIGWMYILLDDFFGEGADSTPRGVSVPIILFGISFFTFQYWASGILYAYGVDRSIIFWIMSILALIGFQGLDGTKSGLVTSVATALGGPLIEVGLITFLAGSSGGYHYTDTGETGFFPLWIVPVYFLGGPANGNLARGMWNALGKLDGGDGEKVQRRGCTSCGDTRVVPCPNCEGVGYYMTYGKEVKCNCCKGRGLVICRNCFDWYDEDPADILSIRDFMSRLPD